MNNEIKEILEEMEIFKEHFKKFKNVDVYLQYNGEQITQLIDYINKLQIDYYKYHLKEINNER